MPKTILDTNVEAAALRFLRQGERVVLVTILASQGSTPRHAGTRALFIQEGLQGTVGGGVLEAKACLLAKRALRDVQSLWASYSFEPGKASDMVCGGSITVLCEVLQPRQSELFAQAQAALQTGQTGLWVVSLHNLEQDKGFPDCVNEPVMVGVERNLLLGKCRQGPSLEQAGSLYLEPLIAQPVLFIAGAGHVSLELAKCAHACGFVIDVADDRAEFANAQRFFMARKCFVLPHFTGIREHCALNVSSYVAIMTRGHTYDQEVLAQILRTPVRYVGMIGSRKKRDHVYAALRAQGVSQERLDAVHCPIGLDLKAETPQQIAVSIVAELLCSKNGVDSCKSLSALSE
ncbi:MAG: XdhC family protein [Desulfovibrio sp.]|nr:XdhC family protein [Desulfovibrio sp.]